MASSESSSNFQTVFNAALEAYEKATKNKLLKHPLSAQLESCNSPDAILSVLKNLVQQSDRRSSDDERLRNWLDPTVKVLYTFSATLGGGAGLVTLKLLSDQNLSSDCSFSGISCSECDLYRHRCPSFGESLSRSHFSRRCDTGISKATKDVNASQDMLVDLFGRIDGFIMRLELYKDIPPTHAMMDIIMKIMVEIISILSIATAEIEQGQRSEPIASNLSSYSHFVLEKILNRLLGKSDIEAALKRLDTLSQEEARMAIVEVLKVTCMMDDRFRVLIDGAQNVVFSHTRYPELFISAITRQSSSQEGEEKCSSYFNLLVLVTGPNYFRSKAVETGSSKMAFSTGLFDKPQRFP